MEALAKEALKPPWKKNASPKRGIASSIFERAATEVAATLVEKWFLPRPADYGT